MSDTTDYKATAHIAVAALIFIAGLGSGAFLYWAATGSTWERALAVEHQAVSLGYAHMIDRGGFWSGGYEFQWDIPPKTTAAEATQQPKDQK